MKPTTSKDFIVRRTFSDAERRAIVAETLQPGNTVGAVARAHKLTPPTVFNWKRRYKLGKNKETVPMVGTVLSQFDDPGCGQPINLHGRIQELESEISQLKMQLFKLKAYVGGKLFELENLQ